MMLKLTKFGALREVKLGVNRNFLLRHYPEMNHTPRLCRSRYWFTQRMPLSLAPLKLMQFLISRTLRPKIHSQRWMCRRRWSPDLRQTSPVPSTCCGLLFKHPVMRHHCQICQWSSLVQVDDGMRCTRTCAGAQIINFFDAEGAAETLPVVLQIDGDIAGKNADKIMGQNTSSSVDIGFVVFV